MKTKLSKYLSVEELEEVTGDIVDVSDVEINEETNELDINDDTNEAKDMVASVDEGLENVAELQEQVSLVENTPEVSQEALKQLEVTHAKACEFFGMSRRNVSCESMSKEGFVDTVKESVKKMIEIIKAVFAKFSYKFKEIYARILASLASDKKEIADIVHKASKISLGSRHPNTMLAVLPETEQYLNKVLAKNASISILNSNHPLKGDGASMIDYILSNCIYTGASLKLNDDGESRLKVVDGIAVDSKLINDYNFSPELETDNTDNIILSGAGNKVSILSGNKDGYDYKQHTVEYNTSKLPTLSFRYAHDDLMVIAKSLNQASGELSNIYKKYDDSKKIADSAVKELEKQLQEDKKSELNDIRRDVNTICRESLDSMMAFIRNFKLAKHIFTVYYKDALTQSRKAVDSKK